MGIKNRLKDVAEEIGTVHEWKQNAAQKQTINAKSNQNLNTQAAVGNPRKKDPDLDV